MTTNADTSQASGLGERNSNIGTEFSNFVLPDEIPSMRPLSFLNTNRPSLNPEPVSDSFDDLTPLLALRRQNAVVAERVSYPRL